MGYQRHNAIIVTSFDEKAVINARIQAKRMFGYVSEISPKMINNYTSFFIPPDGSKEGWPESDAADSQRNAFMDWCKSGAYEDGSNILNVVDVSFAGDGDAKIDNEV